MKESREVTREPHAKGETLRCSSARSALAGRFVRHWRDCSRKAKEPCALKELNAMLSSLDV